LTSKTPIAERVLAVLSATCLVAAFALCILLQPLTPLGRLISMINHDFLVSMQNGVRANLPEWVWRRLFLPVLERPSWLPLLGLALIFGGAALTLASRGGGLPRTPRWRN
jgi:hypothetical protein